MKKTMKRLLSLLLAGAVTVSSIQVGAWAQESRAANEVRVLAGRNAYAQGGNETQRNTPVDAGINGPILRVKTDAGGETGTTTRKTAMEFDLIGAPANCNSAVLELQIQRLGPKFSGISGEVFTVEENWDASALTWNNFPSREKQVGVFSMANIGGSQGVGDIAAIDISEAVTAALAAGETKLNIELSFPNKTSGDGAFEFSSTRATGTVGGSAAVGPTLVLTNDAGKEEEAAQFAALRAKWKEYLLGGDYDLTDATVQGFVQKRNDAANEYWNAMNKSTDTARTFLWDDLPITNYTDGGRDVPHKTSSGNMGESFNRLQSLATAYGMKGCDLYQNAQLKEEILKGIDFMIEKYYNLSVLYYGNWFHWEITAPTALLSTCVILYDSLTTEKLETYTKVVERFTNVCDQPSGYPGSPPMTGANLLDKAVGVALDGVLLNKTYKLEHVRDAQKSVYQYVTSGDGFYTDGSYIQHNTLAYTAGYGSTLYGKAGLFFYMLTGTPWEIAYDDQSEQMVYDTIFNSVEPLIYDGQFMDMTAGRGIVRPTANVLTRGAGIIEALLPIGEAMTGEMKARFQSMVKYFIGIDPDFYFSRSSSLICTMMAKKIMEDDSIAPRAPYSVHKTYAGMDRIVHSTPDYGFGLSMSSSRTSKYENYSNEGYRIWNIADGMTYLHTDDRDQYTTGFWATIDPRRLPGTTSEYIMRQKCAPDREAGRTSFNWAGGADIGNYGVAGVQMQALGSTLAVDGAVSQKSWFMFGDEIVALGSGISSKTGNPVETVIDNRQISLDLANKVTIDGATPEITDNSGTADSSKFGTAFQDVKWANIEGNTANSSIGYYFPRSGTEIRAMKERRDSNWNTQGPNDLPVSGSYAALWFEHGTNPTDEAYEYVILPNKNAEETKAYSENPGIEVLANNTDVQAVRQKELGLTGLNFWNDKEVTLSGITCDKKASVMIRTTDDTVEISVSDPTQANSGSITLQLGLPCTSVVSKDDTITVEQTQPGVKISVNVAKTYGAGQKIVLKRDNNSTLEAVSMPAIDDIKVPVGTLAKDLELPKTVRILANDLKEYDVAVAWNTTNYASNCYGLYRLEGILSLPAGMQNTVGLKAAVNVQVGEVSVKASQDSFVSDSASEKPGANKSATSLVVKNDAPGYFRKSIMKFPLSTMPADFEHAYLTFELIQHPSETFSSFCIYETEAGWDQDTLSWSTFPARISDTPVSTVTLADVDKSLSFQIEITELAKKALAEGKTELSFEFSIPDYSKNNYTGIASLENKNCQPPQITWEKTPVFSDPSALSELYAQNEHRSNADGRYSISSWAVFNMARNNAKSVLANASASQSEIDTAKTTLQSAVDGLVNISTLKMVLGMANSHVTNGDVDKLVPAAKEKFNSELLKAQNVYDDPNATQDAVDKAWSRLIDIIHALGFVPGDAAELTALVAEAKVIVLKNYQDGAEKDAFTKALSEAEALLLDENAMQADFDAAYETLEKAMNALIPLPVTADKTELGKVIETAKGYDLSKYVDDSNKISFEKALADAKNLYENNDKATQGEIDAMRSRLLTAMASLRFRADKASLNDWIDTLKSIDLSYYTKESAEALRAVIAKAEVLAAKDLGEDETALIQAMIAEMVSAKDNLVKAEEPENPDESSKPEEPSDSSLDGSGASSENTSSDKSSSGETSTGKTPTTGDAAPIAAIGLLALAAGALAILKKKKS